MAKERIGILGGTFDPIHTGHIRMAQSALSGAKLDRVLILPTGNPPHKTEIAPAEDRYRMVCAACAGLDGLEPSRVELDREGTIYTVDTLSILHEMYPRAALYYIIGADTLMELHKWRRAEHVLTLCTFLVCRRAGSAPAEDLEAERRRLTALGAKIRWLDMEAVEVSSTQVRQALASGETPELVPVPVRAYCHAAGLYGAGEGIPGARTWLAQLFLGLKRKRYAHTLAVAETARRLARIHGLDETKAEIAGLLHDCAKSMPLADMQALCLAHEAPAYEDAMSSVSVLHAIAGMYAAKRDYGMTDPEVLEAIRCHTTGLPGMSPLAMAVALADSIEPLRDPYPQLEEIRALADVSLERALLCSLEGTVRHVKKKGFPIHPATAQTIQWLKSLPQMQRENISQKET